MIRAAGGVVVRDGRILLVHRPKYDDWSLPKGKCTSGETDEECALREVAEETGLSCEIVGEAGETRYLVLKGPKLVRYFLMRPVTGEFTPHDEVDEIRWVPIAKVRDLLTHEDDYGLIEQAGLT